MLPLIPTPKDLASDVMRHRVDDLLFNPPCVQNEWGHAQCEAEVKLDRALVAKVISEAKLEIKVGKHKVTCNLEQEDGKETHKINFTIDPVVTF